MKKILLLSTILLASSIAVAQKFDQRTSFWLKPNQMVNVKQTLNKNASVTGNTTTNLSTSLQPGYSNFYVVFKSEDAAEKDLLNFTFTCTQHTLTTHNINHAGVENIDLKRKTGAIVKYGFNFPNAVGDKNFVSVADVPNDLTDVYEVIYVNEEFSDLDHQQIQTYLSLKYGISLIESGNYVDSNGTTIWNKNLNVSYNHFITGLGKSDYFGLNKTETTNSIDKRLAFEVNDFSNNNFLLIGTTNQNTNFIKQNNYEVLDSAWLVQVTGASKLVTLRFNLNQKLKKEGVYELLINQKDNGFENNDNVVKVAGKIEGNQLVFENVYFDNDDNGFDTFTIGYSSKVDETSKPIIVSKADVKAYPNPVEISQDVTVDYSFDKPTNLKVHVFTVEGKFISKAEVNEVNNYQFKTNFTSSGVYLIVSTYDGQLTTNRIIVK